MELIASMFDSVELLSELFNLIFFFFRTNQEKKSNIIRELDLIKENIKKETSKLNTAKTKEANLEKLFDSAKARLTDLTNSFAKDLGKFNL